MSESNYPAGNSPTQVLSVSPVVLPAPDRAVDLELRISAPVTGSDLPIILLSHGHGPSNNLSSLNGYAPLANFWAAHGFVVIQPTHLSSRTLSLPPDTPGAPLYWRSRAEDMTRILDHLDVLEAAVPQLHGRLDHSRVAVAGHSMGGHTASLLLGARLTDPDDGTEVNLAEPRIRAGVLLAAPGRGGNALSPYAAENYPFFLTTDFSRMATPTLVVVGDRDSSTHLTVRGPDWHVDPYRLSPGRKDLLTLYGAEHGLGGVSGYDVAETTDESPERVSVVQRLTSAYLRSQLHAGDSAWQAARDALAADSDPLGRVESR
ncbi:alpha/beta hydrolase family protein [Micromonospora sp. NBC_01796]|uniref:alpha/beta hydrolase family protein n=1 Tax=Micromonospora sp. NBC_01796 TaxID=2975987 RepID=UPI002DD906E3|nr:chlorophyllase [Micromonospora sp. NBC_01796]WSA82952.1 chlorophyllase [Micromonospora sp. NBC_01796]